MDLWPLELSGITNTCRERVCATREMICRRVVRKTGVTGHANQLGHIESSSAGLSGRRMDATINVSNEGESFEDGNALGIQYRQDIGPRRNKRPRSLDSLVEDVKRQRLSKSENRT